MSTPRKTSPHPMPDHEILNIDDAAAFLGVSVKTFGKVLREGDVPARKVGREWKFSRQALVDWVASTRSRDFLDKDDSLTAPATPPRRRRGTPRLSRKDVDGFSVDEL